MRGFALPLVVAALGILPVQARGAIVLDENFDELTQQLGVTSAGAFSTIGGTNVDIVGPSLFSGLCVSPESGNCVDINGTGGNPQGQLQSNTEFAAGSYLLSFDLIGSGRLSTDGTTVTFGNYSHDFSLASGDDSSGIVVNQLVTLTSPGFLLFTADQGGNVGNLLDNVVVSTSPSSVPEPSSVFPLGFALLAGILLIERRRRVRSVKA